MKKILTICFILILTSCKLYAQQIKIINIEKQSDNNGAFLNINCQLINDSEKEIILPLQIEEAYNDYSSYYNVKTSPKDIFYKLESVPFPLDTEYPKLTKENLLICKPKSTSNFVVKTNKMRNGGLKMYNDKNLKKIKVIYFPFIIQNKEMFLESEIKDIQFYDKKIESNFFVLEK
ncbi:hypothetical protein [Chryseobacterium polytrichastri]|uniref:Uncharacterized protein n=1 Tax=Chryseobacterium polytrichastri TaxID=1302687 RepID=A0A1M7BSW1_9FLAO|nr:hypothetical protein [Chryseobacterium polytrichastri]SHL58081.1 hypothetical protein SAMN05444267_102078 [Chryseobacterium polytrichastri]